MDKKKRIVEKMNMELEEALQVKVELISGESLMTLQYAYGKLKESFEQAFIPDCILDIISSHEKPLFHYYEYFLDHDGYMKVMDWQTFAFQYAQDMESSFYEEKLHEKVQKEYKDFMTKMVDMSPYKVGKLVTEIGLKMEIYSIFRYKDCFRTDEMMTLLEVDDLMGKAYEKHDNSFLPTDDEHVIWAKAMSYLGKVIEDERGMVASEEYALER